MRGRIPKPTAVKILEGNPGKRAINHAEPMLPEDVPDCPGHLEGEARVEWFRLVLPLHESGVLMTVDRGALAAYCQAWSRWVDAEEKLKTTPILMKTPSGYIQQNPWLGIANKQMELMGRYMSELGITPASRSRVVTAGGMSARPHGGNTIEARAAAPVLTRLELARRVAFLLSCGMEELSDAETMARGAGRIATGLP